MPRTAMITKEKLVEAAMQLLEAEGIEQVTARKVAAKAGCSTQPIFRLYKNMGELIDEVVHCAADKFDEYYTNFKRVDDTPFVNLGLAYISFAKDNENIFRLLFASHIKKPLSTYELINGRDKGYVLTEVDKCTDRALGGAIFSDIWMYIHGCACLVLNDEFDLTEAETVEAIKGMYAKLAK